MADLVEARVTELPFCSFCTVRRRAEYDFRTTEGSWAYGCEKHYIMYRYFFTLGTGKGQLLVLANREDE